MLGINALYQAGVYYRQLVPKAQLAAFMQRGNTVTPDSVSGKLQSLDKIARFAYVSPEEAIGKAMNDSPNIKDILITGDNPFAPYFLVFPREVNLATAKDLREKISRIEGIDEVRFDYNIFAVGEKLLQLQSFYTTILASVIVALLVLAIGKTIRSIVHTRRDYGRHVSAALRGLLSGIAGGLIYFIVSTQIAGATVTQMPPRYLLLILPVTVVLSLAWEE
jgi:cell division protein FtsX